MPDHDLIAEIEREFASTLHPTSGFLPPATPLIDLPEPFAAIAEAARELAAHYHGEHKDCRPWLDERFTRTPATWLPALASASRPVLESLMTKTSLLCHAYRWRFMPTDPGLYQLKSIILPPALETIWTAVARHLGIPRVGMFYTMVTCNWRLDGVEGGKPYAIDDLQDGRIRLIDSWLLPPEDCELTAFISAALMMEAQGRKAADCMLHTYDAMRRDDVQEVAYRLVACRDVLKSVLDAFNSLIRKDRMDISNFLKLVQPTMLWLLDHGDGALEGASGPQACTLQLLDNFLGVPRNSELGTMILKSRRYLLPEHRRLLEKTDACHSLLRRYVEKTDDTHLTELFNQCVGTFLSWRRSHQKRGAMYLKGKPEDKVDHYASTGLVVSVDSDRVKTFEATMEQHIRKTESRLLQDPWEGRERSFDAVFRHMGEEQRLRFRQTMRERPVQSGEILVKIGQRRPGLMLLAHGQAQVRRSVGLQKVPIGRLGPNEVFGEMSMLENEPAGAEVVATVDGLLAHLPLDDLYALFREDPALETGLYRCLGKFLSARLRKINAILPDLLARETSYMRPLRTADECQTAVDDPVTTWQAEPWFRFVQANAFHRDFWPAWMLQSPHWESSPAPHGPLQDIAALRAAPLPSSATLTAETTCLFLGVGPHLGRTGGTEILVEPSPQVLAAWKKHPESAATRCHHENLVRLAQGFGFLELPPVQAVYWDFFLGFVSESEAVEVFNWIYHRLQVGGVFQGSFFTPAAASCPIVRTFGIPIGTARTEETVSDWFTRSGWGARPVDFRTAGSGTVTVFACTR